jgi:putative hemolysin
MSPELRSFVRNRAGGRCEYCRFPDGQLPWSPFHVDHLVARQHGGGDESNNLAWACARCNSRKGTNLSGVDPDSSEVVRLFHPRSDRWDEHFVLRAGRIVGLTVTGRATVWLLQMNPDDRVALRLALVEDGLW